MRVPDQSTRHPTALQQAFHRTGSGFAAVAIFSFFLNLLMLATPLYTLQVFQRVLTSGQLPTLLYLTGLTLFALLVLGMLNTLRAVVLSRISGWLSGVLGTRLISSSLSCTLAGTQIGAQPLRDLGQLQAFIGGSGITAFFDAPWVPVFVLAIWIMHPWLGALAAGSAVALFLLAFVNEMMTRTPQKEATENQARAHKFADTSLRNAEAVHAMGMMGSLLGRWQELNGAALDKQGTAGTATAAILSISKFLRLSVQVGILGLGAMLVLRSELTPGQMIAASILLGRALAPVEQSLAAWRGFVTARTGFKRLQGLLQAFPEQAPSTALPPPQGHIHVDNMTFKPPGAERPVLQQISFALMPGEVLGLIGPSAAGKSTLCRLLVGVWPPSFGSVRLDSAEVHAWNREELGCYVGYLPQDVELFAGTVSQNIARMGQASDEEVIEAAQLAGVHDMVLRLADGYDTEIGEGGAKLSAGQRKRVGLARALFGKPRVLVLDEPNANLDRIGETALLRTLSALKQRGTTIIIAAHQASMLEGADKLLVLREGKMDAFGAKSDVLTYLKTGEPLQHPVSRPRAVPNRATDSRHAILQNS